MVKLDRIEKNIWVAASDGDLDRVRALVESGIQPNTPDEHTYTPLHAAASWGRLDVLRYLSSRGGNINITDDDGDTPLFAVEDLETAKLVIELGGDPLHRNLEGLTAAESLSEDYPDISDYLRALTGESDHGRSASGDSNQRTADELDPTGQMTASLLDRVRDIMSEAESSGVSPDSAEVDAQLRALVSQTVDQTVGLGRRYATGLDVLPPSIGANNLEAVREDEENEDQAASPLEPNEANKRQRT